MGNEYVHIVINLLIVLFLLVLFVFALKKIKLGRVGTNKHIKVLNMVSIGAKEKIVLVEINNTCLLLGSTPNQISTLHVFEEMAQTKESVEHYVSHQTFAEVMGKTN